MDPTPRLLFSSTMLLCAFAARQGACQEEIPPKELIDALLNMPAPPADWKPVSKATKKVEPPRTPEQRVRDALEDKAGPLFDVLYGFPEDDATIAKVKARYDTEERERRFTDTGRARVREWLMYRSAFFREELLQRAGNLAVNDGRPLNQRAIESLAKLDWPAADALLRKQADAKDLILASHALGLLYQRAVAAKDDKSAEAWRKRLKAIAADKGAAVLARVRACEVLTADRWPGREEWFLERFSDESLRELSYGHSVYYPLCDMVRKDPDFWIPRISPMLGGPAHETAVQCLIQFTGKDARADALEPLLPWLTQPDWSKKSERGRLIQSLDCINLPASVPGLIWVAEHEKGYELAAAADALAFYRAPDAAPLLKAAMLREPEGYNRRSIIKALVALDGLTLDDMAGAVEAYARQAATPLGRKQLQDADEAPASQPNALMPAVSVGRHLSCEKHVSEELAQRLIARVKELEDAEPAEARVLRNIVHGWPVRTSDQQVLLDILAGKAGAPSVAAALSRRETLRRNAPVQLAAMRRLKGLPAGVAAVLRADSDAVNRILVGADKEAQRALLACARLVRQALPLARVSALLKSADAAVSLAAERYLEAEDSPAARKMILARYPGQACILGAWFSFDPRHGPPEAFRGWEERLRQEVLAPDGPDEIIALLSPSYFGDCIIRCKRDSAELALYNDPSRYRKRPMGADEIAKVRAFLDENKVDELPPYMRGIYDGFGVTYMRLGRDGGRRVFMNAPGAYDSFGHEEPGEDVYGRLAGYLRGLADEAAMTLHYPALETIPGAAVLFADTQIDIQTVLMAGGKVCVFLRGPRSGQPGKWREFHDGNIRADVPAPQNVIIGERLDDVPKEMTVYEESNRDPWQVSAGNDRIRASFDGLYRCRKGVAALKIADGRFSKPIVTPDGKWAVAAKTDTHWGDPKYVVRVDLANAKVYPLDVPPADNFDPVAFVPAHNKVLLHRQKDAEPYEGQKSAGPAEAEFRLLDASTGETVIVTGEFDPWSDQTFRPLQPTGKPHEVWAVMYDGENGTTVGRYDTKGFTFTPVARYAGLGFSSMDMWVNEAAGKVYVAYNGQLLSLPLSPK